MKLTYKDLANPSLTTGMRKLASSAKVKGFKATYNVAKIAERMDAEFRVFESLRQKLAEKVKEGSATEEVLRDEFQKFGEVAFEIDRPQILLSDIEEVGLTANEILALAPVLEEQALHAV